MEKSISILSNTLGVNHPETLAAKRGLERINDKLAEQEAGNK